MNPQDLKLIYSWRSHSSIRKFMLAQENFSFEKHIEWFSKIQEDSSKHLLIIEEESEPIGFAQFSRLDEIAYWGFYAAPDAPKGTGTKIGKAALEFGFLNLNLHKVCGQVLDFNKASIKLHTKLGFVKEGILREHHKVGSEYYDLVSFGLLSKEWLDCKL